jgi:uncharacterized protein with PQ loop repeat
MLGINPDLMATAATIYGVGAAAAALLQARQILRSKRSCDVSARFFASYAGGYAIWLLYGMSIQSAPLVLVDAIGLLCGGFTLATTLALRGSLVSPQDLEQLPGWEEVADRIDAWLRERLEFPNAPRNSASQ